MGAAILGFSLLGPQVGSASADDTEGSSVSTSSPGAGSPASTNAARDDADAREDTAREDTATDSRADTERDRANAESDEADTEEAADASDVTEDADVGEVNDRDDDDETAAARSTRNTAVAATSTVDAPAPAPEDPGVWVRRTFFNRAPVVAPVQISGRVTGQVAGTVGAVDPEGDQLTYVLIRRPRAGSVQLNDDGTYTYTPGARFTGVDTFRVIAIDEGLHVNLLNPFRGLGTGAKVVVNQGAITFAFRYTKGAEYWTPERREALQRATNDLVEYFQVNRAVTLTYDVIGEENPLSDTLAAAGSDRMSDFPGFWRTVVGNKLIAGFDANGSKADGEIEWNFAEDWALGDTVGSNEFDFTAVAIHELLHSFGFIATLGKAGDNPEISRNLYDRFIVTKDGRSPFRFGVVWNRAYDPNLTGGAGGLFFGGANAVAAYGGLVPLYTPSVWQQGSSVHHLDDATFTGANQKLMNAFTGTGPGVRVLSPIEVGILRDLGYQVFPPTPVSAAAFAGLLFVRVKRRRSQ